MSRSAIIVAFLMTVCAATIRAGQVSNAAVSYVVQSAKTARADVKIVTAPSEHARAIIVTLPFTSKGIATRSHGALIGFATSDLGSAVIAIVPANRNSFIFSCDVDLAGATTSTVRVAQYPDKLVLVVPPPSPALLNEFTLGASDIEVVSTFTSINARLPSGFTVAGENSDVLLKTDTDVPMTKNGTGGIYELGFRAPTSPWMEGAESILQSSVVFIFAVLITIAAPGVVPVQQYFRLVGILAAVLLVFLVLRWVGVVRSHKALVPVASDTLLALMYFGVAYGLPIWRKHSEAASVAGKSGDVVTETSNNKPV